MDALTAAHEPLPVPEHAHVRVAEGMANLPSSLTADAVVEAGKRVEPGVEIVRGVAQIDEFLSREECEALLAGAEAHGFTDMKDEYDPTYRSGERVVVRLPRVAERLWERLRPHLRRADLCDVRPVGFGNEGTWRPVGINPVFRFSRYREGDAFKPHRDGGFVLRDDCRSVFTFMVYLTTTTEGHTVFYGLHQTDPYCFPIYSANLVQCGRVEAVRGRALLFPHDAVHAGARLPPTAVKAIVRTDVMFERIAVMDPSYALHPQFREAQRLYNESILLQQRGEVRASTEAFQRALALQAAFPTLSPQPRPPLGPERDWIDASSFAYLLSFLDVRDIALGVAHVSRAWREAANDDVVWHALFQHRFPRMAAVLGFKRADSAQRVLTAGIDFRSLMRNHMHAHEDQNTLVVDLGSVCTRFTYRDFTARYADMVPYKYERQWYEKYTLESYDKAREAMLASHGPSWIRTIVSVGAKYLGHYWHARSGLDEFIFGQHDGYQPQFFLDERRQVNLRFVGALVRWITVEGHGSRVFQKHRTRHPVALAMPEYVGAEAASRVTRHLLRMACPAVAVVPASVAFLAAHGKSTGVVVHLSGCGLRCVAVVRGEVRCVSSATPGGEFMQQADEKTMKALRAPPAHDWWLHRDELAVQWELGLERVAPLRLLSKVLPKGADKLAVAAAARDELLHSEDTYRALLECLAHFEDDIDTLHDLELYLAGGLSKDADEPFLKRWRAFLDTKVSVPAGARTMRIKNAGEPYKERCEATCRGLLLLSQDPSFQRTAFRINSDLLL